jgi:hypothetical protein
MRGLNKPIVISPENLNSLVTNLRETRMPLARAVQGIGYTISSWAPADIVALRDAVERSIMECEECRFWRATSSFASIDGRMLCSFCRAKLPPQEGGRTHA